METANWGRNDPSRHSQGSDFNHFGTKWRAALVTDDLRQYAAFRHYAAPERLKLPQCRI